MDTPHVFVLTFIARAIRPGAALLCAAAVGLRAQPPLIDAPAPGTTEAGIPAFVILGPEALGLTTAPVDLQRLPDGRLLALGDHELAIGDGVRWQPFRQVVDEMTIQTESVAIDGDGAIYAGIPGGFGRVAFGADGRWRLEPVATLPASLHIGNAIPLGFTSVGNDWFWWWGGGLAVAWRPGAPARVLGHPAAPLFLIGRKIYLTDPSTGRQRSLDTVTWQSVDLPAGTLLDQTITCAVPFGGEQSLIGTLKDGIKIGDGIVECPLTASGLLTGATRVNSLCAVESGLFAAALDNFGIVFFDRTGRVLQVLDRTIDQRFSRVNRLLSTPGGDIWALLNDGIARIAFPSRISDFDPFAQTGLAFAQPYRFQGRLWLLSDGSVQRGVYDGENRLTRFEVDSPTPYVNSLENLNGSLLAGTSAGIFRRGNSGWTLIVPGPKDAHIREDPSAPGRWLYVADNEVGWIEQEGAGFRAVRFSEPTLGHPHVTAADGAGDTWIELGPARVARVEAVFPRPTLHIYGPDQGVGPGWPQLFMIGGGVRLNVAEQIERFDAAGNRFVRDGEVLRRLPLLEGAVGRPALDSRGRLWISSLGSVQVVDPNEPAPQTSVEAMPMGFAPISFAPQRDGVMWMHQNARLVRFDPSVPVPEPAPLHALITDIRLDASGDMLPSLGAGLAPIPASDNSISVHFLAPDNPVADPVVFDVELQGSGNRWSSTGAAGTAAYSRLADGNYVFRVRPRIGERVGAEATLAFTVLAPWYRTRLAYAGYAAGGLATLLLAVWLASYLARKDKARLERIVAARTRELNNAVLARLQGEETLIASETRYRRLFESAKDGILILDADTGIVVDVNPYLAGILGCPQGEFAGKRVWELGFFKDIMADEVEFQRLREKGYARYDDVVVQRADGPRIEVEFVSNVYLVNHRRVIQFNIRDITERKLAEQKVLEQAALLDKANDAIYVRSLDRTILYWNQGAERLYGWTREEAVGRKTSELFTSDNGSAADNQEVLLKTGSWLGERRQTTKSGQAITVLSRLTLVRNSRGEPQTILAINADVTEKKLLESRFLRAQRQESLGLLASGIAHDLNNVLTPIIISAQLLRDFVKAQEGLQMLNTIETSAVRGAGIVKQVLTFARGVEGERVMLQPKHFIKDMSDIAANTFPKNIRVETVIARDLWPILGDATQLQQGLMNLCVNARDAMADGGVLTLRAENVVLDEAFVRSTPGAKPGPHVRLSVIDTGSGIPHDLLDKIFDPFFTTKAPGKGTGLGLSTVHGIMHSHEGFVRVTSEEGKGACFELNFPATPSANVVAVRDGEGQFLRGAGELVLVVDDERAVREVLRKMLERHGYRAVVASEGAEAVGLFLQHRGAVKVVLTDIMMPGVDGPTLVQSLRRIDPNVLIVGMSGSGGKEEVNKTASWSVPVFLSKPFTSETLLEALAQILGKTC